MTYKFVGAIRGMGNLPAYQLTRSRSASASGSVTEVSRKLLERSAALPALRQVGPRGGAVGWLVDAILLSSPYASSTGGFLESDARPGSRSAAC